MKLPVFLALLCTLGGALASDLDFVLINDSRRGFEAVYITSSEDKDWNGNLLADGFVLKPGARIKVQFPKGSASAKWDVNIVDADGLAVSFDDVNLIDVEKITLKDAGNGVSAVVE